MRFLVSLFVPGIIAAMGCGAKPGLKGGVPVTGTVTYQGQPVEGATVVFRSDVGMTAAAGRTDATGHFQLASQTVGDGAMPGSYHVGVSKVDVVAGTITAEEAAKKFSKGPQPDAPPSDLLPEKYKLDHSELTADVTVGGPNSFTFDLVD